MDSRKKLARNRQYKIVSAITSVAGEAPGTWKVLNIHKRKKLNAECY